METFLPLFCFSLSVFLLSRSHLMVSPDSDIRGRLTVDILLFTIHAIPFSLPSDQEAQLSGEQEGGGMGVTWHTGSCCKPSYLWFQGKSKCTASAQVELLTDARRLCAIVLTMTAAIVATHQCCSLCWVLLFVSRPSAIISSLSRSESTWDSCKDTALSITCCACLWGWRSLLCLANHSLFLGQRSFFKVRIQNISMAGNAAVVIEFVHVEKHHIQKKNT